MDNTNALVTSEQPEDKEPRLIPPQEWFEENWPQIHCLSMNMAEFTFAAARALASYGDGSGYWLKAAWDGAMAVGAILNCYPPRYEDVEEYVGVVGLQCQCAESPGKLVLQWLDLSGSVQGKDMSGPTSAKKIITASVDGGLARCKYESASGEEVEVEHTFGSGYNVKFFISPPAGSICCEGEKPPTPTFGEPIERPVAIPDDDFTYTVTLRDAVIDKFGYLRNFYQVTKYRSDGRYADKEFYWESIEGVIWYQDNTDVFEGFSSIPTYGPPHRDRMQFSDKPGGGGGAIPDLNAITYPLHVGCTWNEEEQKYDEVYEYPIEYNENGIIGLARRLDAVAWLIDEANLIPYRACAPEKPTLEGDWRTISFISDETSPYGKSRLRKRFRYRSVSGLGLGEVIDHWRDFTWQAGPVCVQHSGASWGTPQVWAASVDEGKRVILHAAREAGIDADKTGRWTVSGSAGARYGVSGTMRVRQKGGYYWITARDGSEARPLVAET